jgi:7-cyano-7-deazaguanine synthase
MNSTDGVAIVSGGLDSITMLYHLMHNNYRPDVVSFDYGQRHKKELQFAQMHAERFGLRWELIDLSYFGFAIENSGSSLVNPAIAVPEGHYTHESMKQTVVPNRNMVMASIAAGICIARGGHYVAAAPHNGDAAIYPDCRPVFWHLLEDVVRNANAGFIVQDWKFVLPFIHFTKTDVAWEAKRRDVPVHLTWSCYNGRDKHCGRCGTCVERLEALHEAKIDDQTEYEDSEFWKEQVSV